MGTGPNASPPHQYQRCLLCPVCNASICNLKTSNTPKNPDRQFYKCPTRDNFFKWANEVNTNQLIDVPNCGGCAAGVCRVRRETIGPNAGRILFMCRVKEEEGSCGYRVWQDELELSETGLVDERISSSQSTINFDDISATNNDLVEESKNADKGENIVTPMINTSEHFQCREIISLKMGQLKCQEDKPVESSRRPHKRSRYGDIKASGSLVSTCSLKNYFKWADEVNPNQLIDVPNCGGCSAGACRVRRETIGPNAGRILFMCRVKEGEGSCGYRIWQDELEMSSSSQSTNNCDDINATNNLLTLLETMDVKDHVAMRQAAEATFTALDHLPFGHQDFKNRVNELIHCASSLSEIEQSMPMNDSYQRLVERCSRERTRLEEINCVHAETTYTVTNKKKHLKDLHKEISSTLDWLFRIEAELSCFDVEMRDIELGLEQISRDKEELEGKYSIAFKELEETKKLFERKEAEFDAAKAAYYRARALLRG